MKKLSTFSVAFLFTAGIAFAQSNDATVDQDGDNNQATVEQVGSMNQASATQTGNSSEIIIDQAGVSNYAEANHRGDGFIQQIQSGNDNLARAFGGDNGWLSQTQIGDDNVALIGVTRNALIQNSSAEQYQEGNGNHAEVEIRQGNGRWNTIYQSQIGNDNYAIVQDMGNGNNVTQLQEGDENTSIVGNVGNPQLGGMSVLTDQYGNNNHAEVFGSQNDDALIFQTGDWNHASISQTAGSDFAQINQTGNYNTASVSQSN
jgi:hypothetical protein